MTTHALAVKLNVLIHCVNKRNVFIFLSETQIYRIKNVLLCAKNFVLQLFARLYDLHSKYNYFYNLERSCIYIERKAYS